MTDKQNLLVEIGTEELPPKSLRLLSEEFLSAICVGLEKHNLNYRAASPFASPRRLAVLVRGVDVKQEERTVERRGPALAAAFDSDGKVTKAAEGFARSCGVEVEQLEKLETAKGSWLTFRSQESGEATVDLIPAIVREALAMLPIPKRMRWADLDAEFVRPVHWVLLLFGEQVIETDVLGVTSSNLTRGHRFHHPDALVVSDPEEYAKLLEHEGRVIPVFSVRQERIRLLVSEEAELHNAFAVIDQDLLDEVTALVEWPVAMLGGFSPEFLEVPAEALIAAMKNHQKYFHLMDAEGKLLPHFIAVSNIESNDPAMVRAGNERVIRPRLSDAKFFWEQDCKHSLESRLDKLKNVVFEKSLGSLYDKSRRVAELSGKIARMLKADELLGIRAGQLCKCDLLTEMVGEFPELQGIMAEYYARNDGENEAVSIALREYYQPRFGGDSLPVSVLGKALALADRLDALIGIFGIGKTPSGDKDPYGLRRAAIAVLRILIEGELDLSLADLLNAAADAYPKDVLEIDTAAKVLDFVQERIRYYYQEFNLPPDTIEAVLSCRPSKPLDIDRRIRGVDGFRQLPAAQSLAAANKRIHNILKKAKDAVPAEADPTYFKEAAERALFDALNKIRGQAGPHLEKGEYLEALEKLAELREPVDAFFDKVMVMDEDEQVRVNRLALLSMLRGLFLQVADISCLVI